MQFQVTKAIIFCNKSSYLKSHKIFHENQILLIPWRPTVHGKVSCSPQKMPFSHGNQQGWTKFEYKDEFMLNSIACVSASLVGPSTALFLARFSWSRGEKEKNTRKIFREGKSSLRGNIIEYFNKITLRELWDVCVWQRSENRIKCGWLVMRAMASSESIYFTVWTRVRKS